MHLFMSCLMLLIISFFVFLFARVTLTYIFIIRFILSPSSILRMCSNKPGLSRFQSDVFPSQIFPDFVTPLPLSPLHPPSLPPPPSLTPSPPPPSPPSLPPSLSVTPLNTFNILISIVSKRVNWWCIFTIVLPLVIADGSAFHLGDVWSFQNLNINHSTHKSDKHNSYASRQYYSRHGGLSGQYREQLSLLQGWGEYTLPDRHFIHLYWLLGLILSHTLLVGASRVWEY